MPLPASGPISLADIQTEFGGANPISISEYYRGGAYVTANNTNVPTSGTISFSNFYGAAKRFEFTISSNQTNANLRTLAVNAGWNQSAPVLATISGGVYISSNGTGTPALTVNGSFPNGVTLVNSGFIVGMGGAGGRGQDGGTTGSGGGTALSVSVGISINNAGTIAGGGGGGGGGASLADDGKGYSYTFAGSGGGGGRSSAAANSAGGAAGTPGGGGFFGNAGSAGTVSAAGAGGPRGFNNLPGAGGNGGGWGAGGSSGTAVVGGYATRTAQTGGGGAGNAVSGNGNITWIATGTRLGGIS